MNKSHSPFSILHFPFLLLISIFNCSAQSGSIALLCSPRTDSILLRWAPTDPQTWRLGNQYGYVVTRYTLLKDKKPLAEVLKHTLNENPLKPKDLDIWEQYDKDRYAAIAAECIFNSESAGLSTLGNPFVVAQKYKEELHRYSFAMYAADQSQLAAGLSGLYLADRTALPDEKYLYQVYIPLPDSVARIDTASFFTGMSEYLPLPKPVELQARWGDKTVDLFWNLQYLKHIYNSYIVERSDNAGKTFIALSENAVVQLADPGVSPELGFKTDSLPDNTAVFYYRIRGISAFGEQGPPSDSIFGQGRKPLERAPDITSHRVIDNQKIQLSWSYPEDMNPYISGFRVYRSSQPEGRKEKVFEGQPTDRHYTDHTPGLSNYYLVSVFNTEAEKFSTSAYAELIDSIPPMIPTQLTGLTDSTGRVSLQWKHNMDEDIDGYRVYRSNHPDFEFMLISPMLVKDTVFTDSINIKTLTPNIYYKIRAIDQRQNQSGFSELLALRRPDVIPPVSPVIKGIGEENKALVITWVNSSSSDVAFHHIYRKEKNDSVFREMSRLKHTEEIRSTFTDREVKAGGIYTYYMVAEDYSGLLSPPSKPAQCKVISGMMESIRLKKQEGTSQVKLTWSITAEKRIVKILIYRSVGEGPLRLYNHVTNDSFTDNKLSPDKKYTYRVKVVYEDESSSELSNAVSINN